MHFCKDCGGVLNLFSDHSSTLCPSCIQHKSKYKQKRKEETYEAPDLLGEAILTAENGRMVLRSKEGWQLWSAPVNSRTELQTILKSAKLIHSIRSKRKKTD